MAITLAKLYATAEKTYHMKLLAGRAGLNKYVRWVHMIEDLQVSTFLHGDELVFTTGIGQSGTAWLVSFVRQIYESHGAGLVVNLGPYIDAVPPQVIVFCEQHGLPLFQVPWAVHLIDITYDFCHRIVENEENEMSLANALRDLIFSTRDLVQLRPTLDRHGFTDADSYCVVSFSMTSGGAPVDDHQGPALRFLAHRLFGRLGCRFSLFNQEEALLAVVDGVAPDVLQSVVEDFIRACAKQDPPVQAFAGIGTQENGFASIPGSFRKANAAARLARLQRKPCLHYRELGVYKLLLAVDDPAVLRDVSEETLGPLKTFDAENGTDYVPLLRAYIAHDASVQALSQLSGVHRNTINYKIKRIRKILQHDLTQEEKLKIMLAFYIDDLLQ